MRADLLDKRANRFQVPVDGLVGQDELGSDPTARPIAHYHGCELGRLVSQALTPAFLFLIAQLPRTDGFEAEGPAAPNMIVQLGGPWRFETKAMDDVRRDRSF